MESKWRALRERWQLLAILALGAAALASPTRPPAHREPFTEMAPRLSYDGRTMVCEQSRNPGMTDVWWVDLQTHQARPIHRPGNGSSFSAQISRDGKAVLFASRATNLTSSGKAGWFYWEADKPLRQIANNPEWPATLAPDGSTVVYANNPLTIFMGHPQPGPVTVQLWKSDSGKEMPLSILPQRTRVWMVGAPAFSPDSRRLAVALYEIGPAADCQVWHGTLQLSATLSDLSLRRQVASALSEPCYNLCLSDTALAFASAASNLVDNDRNLTCDIFLCEPGGGKPERVVGQGGVEPDDDSFEPSLAADGRFLAFTSYADNLTGGDDNSCSDVFLYDRESQQLRCISRSPEGQAGNGPSYRPCLAGDGNSMVFVSQATNLDPRQPRAGQIYRWSRDTGKVEWVPVAGP